MSIILLALINTLIGTMLNIRWKGLRTRGLNIISSFGFVCFGVPWWLASFIILNNQYDIVYSQEYFFYVFLWTGLVILANLGSIYLMKFQALSEMALYKLGFSTALGIAVDLVIFKTDFNLYILTGIFLLLISGILLSKNRKVDKKGILTLIAATFIVSVLAVSEFSIYKYALPIQPNPVIHGMISQLVAYTFFLFFAFKYLKKDYALHVFDYRDILSFGLLIFLFTVTEALLFQELPVTILILLSVISLLIYTIYDIKKKEIVPSWQIYLAGTLSIVALIMINVGN